MTVRMNVSACFTRRGGKPVTKGNGPLLGPGSAHTVTGANDLHTYFEGRRTGSPDLSHILTPHVNDLSYGVTLLFLGTPVGDRVTRAGRLLPDRR
jgi:hypothetical protein